MPDDTSSRHDRWARLRFAIIGPLLAAPPRRGQLEAALRALAAQSWRHPLTEQPVGFGFSTIERWYYAARHEARDPVGVLRRQRRRDAGHASAMSLKLRELLRAQYQAHPSWSYQLHTDNLAVQVAADAALGGMPSCNTVRRYMVRHALVPQPAAPPAATPGAARALWRREHREVRSFEAEYQLERDGSHRLCPPS
jgi:hypothetical protein